MVGLHDVGFSDRPAQPHWFGSPRVGFVRVQTLSASVIHWDQSRRRNNVKKITCVTASTSLNK